MATEQKSDSVLDGRKQQNKMRPSSELGSPMPTRGSSQIIKILQSSPVPDTPLPDSGSPLWDSMSLPSSPSPKRKPEPSANLDRWSSRGFSEDVGLPPRQIEKPFRFLDLPPELRNMIYGYAFSKCTPRCDDWECSCCWRPPPSGCSCESSPNQFSLPPIVFVNKHIRLESLSLYYSTNDFRWFWDPLKMYCEYGYSHAARSVQVFEVVLNFLSTNAIQLRSCTICSPQHHHGPTRNMESIIDSVRFLAPLWKNVTQIGKAHPMIREFKFADKSTLAYRIFAFAGSLETSELESEKLLDARLRVFLKGDEDAANLVASIEYSEYETKWYEQRGRRRKKSFQREENRSKGEERWTGVLRSRIAK
ncbi:hypothetical protein AUEXF2481DRAFT_29425 [Aureobasidium subglaciale EXF-2481]|uniref:F-box domain-containing protein n=1 Tax=Aureobasidium subglaciale (strain EXF-2481) TaxID=1043005 RepID=A0A074Z932_AURSE|nr:uncharacterized protein AUEXF2481DRAFT_29425 [Aureobasidium subglaciale EXF-2481]KAI5204933.1 hypothetical protein E4T38_04543 [Aureobasidium subglaciale]KAI5223889.1 hypothetical protein E4T40_04319 [Aureobasidium subglaciale]KAI5227419.1 hypothetical protein E4T41_04401 [Aureobasidium subglaciale]KAI5262784.1 hypothetical protein E4T46_04287 [Aureobasidium subglaciale]KEQ95341.1 hypothetical protein AUEXF2481DRAFT_29425 [Aureobasidium subglaciale EXF-2481]